MSLSVKPEDHLLFLCARQHFTAEHAGEVAALGRRAEIDWAAVYQTAAQHGVAPLIFQNLQATNKQQGLEVPGEIMARFKADLMANMLAKKRLAHNASRAISFFAAQSLEVMLVKGVALDALVYRQPWFTVLNDIDLVINLKPEMVSPATYRHFMQQLHATAVEFDYFEHHDVTMNRVLPVDFEQIWADAAPLLFHGQQVWVMGWEDLLISLCINSCRKRYFRLKSLCDIAELLSAADALDWQRLADRARQYDCSAIVYAALWITQATVGCPLPPEALPGLGVQPARARLIQAVSRRTSLADIDVGRGEAAVLGRAINGSLILPYVTLRGYQSWRKIRFALFNTFAGARRFKKKPSAR